jgi:hypothetical protein
MTMRWITVYEREGSWHVSATDREGDARYRTLLDAANAARVHGERLEGEAPGYVIRPQTTFDIDVERSITLHTRIFAPATFP